MKAFTSLKGGSYTGLMSKTLKIGAVLVAVVAVALVWWSLEFKSSAEPAPSTVVGEQHATVIIVPGDEPSTEFKDQAFTSGATALSLTQAVAEVVVQGEGELAFITAINGREADDTKKEYWSLYINDIPSNVGAGAYEVQPQDTLRWEMKTY